MSEQGRPWWNSSQINGSLLSGIKQSPSKSKTGAPNPLNRSGLNMGPSTLNMNLRSMDPLSIYVKKEPGNSGLSSPLCKPTACMPIFSPGSKPMFSPSMRNAVKTEPLNIKTEPMAYLERALIKGEFPRDFNWPLMKWEPLAMQNSVKSETKSHYIPKPLTEKEIILRQFAPPRRRRQGPPPDWHFIYSRATYEPSGDAREWWNVNVERALNRRREAYLKTKLNDNASIEVRMERIWSFEVAKDDVRRVIAESKYEAAIGGNGNTQNSDTINFGASTSRNSVSEKLPVLERLGQLPTVGYVDSERNKNTGLVPETEKGNTDDVQVVPHNKENIEIPIYTIDDEIEDAMSCSDDDSDDIRIIGEPGSDDVIFIQKKEGEVTFLAHVDGRLVKMNRKRKLCVTFSNTVNCKRSRLITVIDESSEQSSNCSGQKDEQSCLDSEQNKEVSGDSEQNEEVSGDSEKNNESSGLDSELKDDDNRKDSGKKDGSHLNNEDRGEDGGMDCEPRDEDGSVVEDLNNDDDSCMESLPVECTTERVSTEENQTDLTCVEATSGVTSDALVSSDQNRRNAKMTSKNLNRKESTSKSHKVDQEPENADFSELSRKEPSEKQMMMTVVSENQSTHSEIDVIEVMSVSDDELEVIGFTPQVRKQKEDMINTVDLEEDIEVITEKVVNNKEASGQSVSKEDIVVLETVNSSLSANVTPLVDRINSGDKVEEDNSVAELGNQGIMGKSRNAITDDQGNQPENFEDKVEEDNSCAELENKGIMGKSRSEIADDQGNLPEDCEDKVEEDNSHAEPENEGIMEKSRNEVDQGSHPEESGDKVKEDNSYAELETDVIFEKSIDEVEVEQGNHPEVCLLEEAIFEIESDQIAESQSKASTCSDPEKGVCEMDSHMSKKENKDTITRTELESEGADGDVLEINYSTDDSSVNECETDDTLSLHEKDIEVIQEDAVVSPKSRKITQGFIAQSKSTETEKQSVPNVRNTRQRTSGNSGVRVTRQSANTDNQNQPTYSNVSESGSPHKAGIRTRSRRV